MPSDEFFCLQYRGSSFAVGGGTRGSSRPRAPHTTLHYYVCHTICHKVSYSHRKFLASMTTKIEPTW